MIADRVDQRTRIQAESVASLSMRQLMKISLKSLCLPLKNANLLIPIPPVQKTMLIEKQRWF